MKNKEILANLLASHGVQVFPKADGRIEIPQSLVRMIGWGRGQKVYISDKPGFLIVSKEKSKNNVRSIITTGGRARLPVGVLRNKGFEGKPLALSIEKDCIIARVYCDADDILKTLSLDNHSIKSLTNVLLGENSPKLFLLKNQTVVLPLRPPFRFPGYFLSTREVVRFEFPQSSIAPEYFYLLPVLSEPGKYGFLLLNENDYTIIGIKLKSAGVSLDNPNRGIVPMWLPFSGWKIFLNPVEHKYDINKAREACGKTEDFLKNNFRVYNHLTDSGFIIRPAPSLSYKTLEVPECLK